MIFGEQIRLQKRVDTLERHLKLVQDTFRGWVEGDASFGDLEAAIYDQYDEVGYD